MYNNWEVIQTKINTGEKKKIPLLDRVLLVSKQFTNGPQIVSEHVAECGIIYRELRARYKGPTFTTVSNSYQFCPQSLDIR